MLLPLLQAMRGGRNEGNQCRVLHVQVGSLAVGTLLRNTIVTCHVRSSTQDKVVELVANHRMDGPTWSGPLNGKGSGTRG